MAKQYEGNGVPVENPRRIEAPCPECGGRRLKKEALAVTVDGKNIAEVSEMSVRDAVRFFENLHLTEKERLIARLILKEVHSRLGVLRDVGLDYLTLSRSACEIRGEPFSAIETVACDTFNFSAMSFCVMIAFPLCLYVYIMNQKRPFVKRGGGKNGNFFFMPRPAASGPGGRTVKNG